MQQLICGAREYLLWYTWRSLLTSAGVVAVEHNVTLFAVAPACCSQDSAAVAMMQSTEPEQNPGRGPPDL